MRASFENGAGQAYGILDAVQASDGARAKSGRVHHDRITFYLTIEIEMRAIAGVEDGIVLENGDGSFDGVKGVAALRENRPADLKGAAAASLARFDGLIGDVPGATVNDERGKHKQ